MYGSDTEDNSESLKESASFKRSLPPPAPKPESAKIMTAEVSAASIPAAAIATNKNKDSVTVAKSTPAPTLSFTAPTKYNEDKKPLAAEAQKITPPALIKSNTNEEAVVAKSAQDVADHLSIGCHLFPRLSESNLQFHDIYWNFDRKTQTAILRKRVVKVSRLLKLVSVKQDKQQRAPRVPEFQVEIYFVDCRPQTHQQIVSNVLCVAVPGDGSLMGGKSSSSRPVVLIRSNYAQPEVKLRLVLKQQNNGAEVGHVQVALLDKLGKQCFASRQQTHLFGDIRLTLDISDVPARLVPQVDCLPDVLICEEGWVPMIASFRQLTCERLADMENSPQTTWIVDPILATFPRMLTKKNLVDLFIALLAKQKRTTIGSATFRAVYMDHILPLLDDNHERGQATNIQLDNALDLLTCKPCSPLNIYDYTLQICGKHALD